MEVKHDRKSFSIDVSYDEGTWCGTSNNIPGLFLEADTRQEFLQAVLDIAPYLIEKNLKITGGDIWIEFNVSHNQKTLDKTNDSIRPIYSFKGEALQTFAMAL